MSAGQFEHGYALVIGAGRDLAVTVKDAEGVAGVLRQEAFAAYPPGQVFLLTEGQASKEAILRAFDELRDRVTANAKDKATVMVYFSGHGGSEGGKYFLLPNDYRLDELAESAIPADLFTEKINGIPAQKTIVVLDCCHAGGVKDLEKAAGRRAGMDNVVSPLVHALDSGSGRVIIASSGDHQKSYYKDGAPFSVFTGCLIEALSGKNTPADQPFVSFTQVWDYLDKEVPKRAPGPQQPVIQAQNLTGFLLCRRPMEALVEIPKIFIVHDPADNRYLEALRKQLAVLARRGKLQHWDQSDIMAGSLISATIDQQLRTSQMVVLLVSADYLNSDDCFELQQKAVGLGKPVLPVIVRDCLYTLDDLINDLPKEPVLDGKLVPVALWPDQDQAMAVAAHHISRKAKELQT